MTGVGTDGRLGATKGFAAVAILLGMSPPVVRGALLRPPKRASGSCSSQEKCSICYNFPCQADSIRHTLGESLVFETAFEIMEEPRSDIDFGAFININMDRAVRRLRAMFRVEALHEEGLSVQEWRALLNLARFGECHLRELARLASLDATHTGRAALELERKGLIRRSDDEHDGRRKRLRVTNAGHEVVDRVWAKALKLDARIQSRLGKTRYNAVKEALAILLEMLAEKEEMQEVHASE